MMRLQHVLGKWQSHLLPRSVSLASKSSITDVKPAESDSSWVRPEETGDKALPKSKLVAQVFANLNDKSEPKKMPYIGPSLTQLELKIKNAKDAKTLLEIADNPNLTRKMALNILSTFGDWTAEKKIQLSDFEADVRFLKMCRILSQDIRSSSIMGDLATVLGVTGDDEAAKLISSATLNQMVRILEKLSSKKKRSPPLLRSLAFNISKSDEKLNVKQCADVLYAMANLSFHDEVLLVKTCSDAYNGITNETKSSVVGSVARSLGIMKCRDVALLDRMAEWIVSTVDKIRPQDAVAILMAMAIVNHQPVNSDILWKTVIPLVRPLDLPTSGVYLDAVWSLLLLNRQTTEHVAVVLSAEFIDKLRKEDGQKLSLSTTLKLYNINAAARHCIKNYKGPTLKPGQVPDVPLTRSKDKITLVNCVMDSLLNLLPGENFLKRDVDTGAGFIIDGECVIDKNCTPLTVDTECGEKAIRVAIMVLGYHDTCISARYQPNGFQAFSKRLLEAKGYRVLPVLHSEFSPTSKLVNRVQFLEQKLKSIISNY